MADRVIAPRRNEPVTTAGGYPTVRFSRYLEAVEDVSNSVQEGTNAATFALITGDPNDNAELKRIFSDSELLHYWLR